jgi:hypothetical protein
VLITGRPLSWTMIRSTYALADLKVNLWVSRWSALLLSSREHTDVGRACCFDTQSTVAGTHDLAHLDLKRS